LRSKSDPCGRNTVAPYPLCGGCRPPSLWKNSENQNNNAIYSVVKPYNKANDAIYENDNDF
jgi:hypothetical protein